MTSDGAKCSLDRSETNSSAFDAAHAAAVKINVCFLEMPPMLVFLFN